MIYRRVSEVIGDDYKKWKDGDSVIISSPTGTGKTYFVLNVLVPYAKKLNKKILMFCNRVALYEQINNAIDEDMRAYIEIITYQSAEDQIGKIIMGNVLYYIFDEAHYIFQDSSFNEGTGAWYEHFFSISTLSLRICIYLSATPDDIYMLLANRTKYCFDIGYYLEHYGKLTALYNRKYENDNEKEKYDYYKHYISEMDYYTDYTGQTPYSYGDCIHENIQSHKSELAKCYTQDICYDYLTCKYFSDYTEIKKRITESEDKWLIFVNKKSDGQILCKELNQLFVGTRKRAVFISSQSRQSTGEDNREFKNIIEDEKFSCNILISTSVLDNGVNIKDKQLKNIVISAYDKTEFVQMLGRRRVEENDRVTLYIRYFSINTFSGLKKMTEDNIDFLMWFYEANKVNLSKMYANGTWYENRRHKPNYAQSAIFEKLKRGYSKGLLCRNKDFTKAKKDDVFRDFKINYIALMKQISLRYYYTKVMQSLKEDKLAFLKLQLSWLGKEYADEDWLSYEEKMRIISETEKYLQSICGKYLDKKEQMQLRTYLYSNICKFDRLEKSQEANLPGRVRLNKAISECGLTFVITSKQFKRNTYWVVKKSLQCQL